MSQAYDALRSMIELDRQRETTAYDARTERRALFDRIVAEIEDAWTVSIEAIGLMKRKAITIDTTFFTNKILAAEGARYLFLNYEADDGDTPPAFPARTVEIRRNAEGDLFVFDVNRRVSLGHVYAGTFRHVWHKDREPGGCEMHSLFYGMHLLPLSGPLVDKHPTAQRVARFAARLEADPRLERIFDLGMIAHESRNAFTPYMELAIAYATDALGDRRAALEAAHPVLAADLSCQDWSHHYSDMYIKSAADRETRIKENLAALDLDDAACLFVVHARSYWTYMASHLARHPALLPRAA